MATTIKSLLRTSMVIRNLGTLNNCAVARCLIRSSAACGPDRNKDLVSARPHLVSQNRGDATRSRSLQKVLKSSLDTMEILKIVREKSGEMTGLDAVVAFDRLFHADKASSKRVKNMYEREEFLTLCEIVKREVRHLSPGHVVTVLKVFVFYGVPTSSIIVHILLQTLRTNVNELPLEIIMYLDFLLRKCDTTPLVEALRIALPIVFEANVLLRLDRNNLRSIVSALRFLSNRSTSTSVLESLLVAIENCKEPMDTTTAKSIILSLCDLRCSPPSVSRVAGIAQSILARNIATLHRTSITRLLRQLAESRRNRPVYHEGFADACGSIAISQDWGFDAAFPILVTLTWMDHIHIPLLDYIAAKCFEDLTIFERCLPTQIAELVNCFSNADYKPVFWEVIHEAATSDRVLASRSFFFPESLLAVDLLTLDCYCPRLLARVFDTDWSTLSKSARGHRVLLYQAVKTLYPQYDGPLPDSGVDILSPNYRQFEKDYPLVKSLESALGGSRYVLTRVRSKLGHHIDHVLVMRKGGFPVAINNNAGAEMDEYPLVKLEDLQPPPDAQVLLILYVERRAYSVNTQRMKGPWMLKIKTLESLTGHTAIVIQPKTWSSLQCNEKIPYLMQAIRLKCDGVSISANS